MSISNNCISFHLQWKKNLIKYWKVSKYYETDCRFNDVYPRANLPESSSAEIKDEAYVINTDEYSDIGTHWVAMYLQNIEVTYFDSFRAENILKEIRTFISNETIKANTFRITSVWFTNVWISLYWFYWFYVYRKDFNFFHQITKKKRWYNFKLFYD